MQISDWSPNNFVYRTMMPEFGNLCSTMPNFIELVGCMVLELFREGRDHYRNLRLTARHRRTMPDRRRKNRARRIACARARQRDWARIQHML